MGGICCSNPEQDTNIQVNKKLYRPVDYQQRLEEVLEFWFRGDDEPAIAGLNTYDREQSLPPKYMQRWFRQSQQFDDIVKDTFALDFERLKQGLYKEWENSHDGRLALIILCDQLSRCFYRGKKEAFMFDETALKIAKRLVSKPNEYKQYKLVERLFILLPFMHSENIHDCEQSLMLIQKNIDYAEEKQYEQVVKQLVNLRKSAEQFMLILKVFKRFPHRNQSLGRKNTPEEIEYFATGKLPELTTPNY